MWTGTAGEQSTKHRGKGGGSTFPELPEPMAGVAALCGKFASQIWQIGRFQPQPQVQPQCALPLIGQSSSINRSQSISLGEGGGGGTGRGRWSEGGSESLGVLGAIGLDGLDWTGPAGGCRRCRHRHRHRQMCTCRPRTLSLHAPPLHPAPCTAEPGNLSCSSHHISKTTLGTLGTPC